MCFRALARAFVCATSARAAAAAAAAAIAYKGWMAPSMLPQSGDFCCGGGFCCGCDGDPFQEAARDASALVSQRRVAIGIRVADAGLGAFYGSGAAVPRENSSFFAAFDDIVVITDSINGELPRPRAANARAPLLRRQHAPRALRFDVELQALK
ncbi:hypothetical protein M885DRAFT_579499 [Pelagophyceae sp. CCMP2097]|nr:hypothetical protein M885DRAFT_579499 [Pelagophyceae sp. CCMP2097]